MRQLVNKQGQLLIVIAGFFVCIQLLAQGALEPPVMIRAILTLAFAVACVVRYWWVILILKWPFTIPRVVLLLLSWTILPIITRSIPDPNQWLTALAIFSMLGALTEIYNYETDQWRHSSIALSEKLKKDHRSGAVAAGLAAVILLITARRFAAIGQWVVALMVLGDWIRLIVMIRSHSRILVAER